MKLSFDVGEQERHRIDFSFDPFWGPVRIMVDGVTVVRGFQFISFGLVRPYEFTVGSHEQHAVRIEVHRKLFFAGFRSRVYRVFVDGRLVHEEER
ncbi:MAG TPA: hypothetical protein VH561_16875 [Micromonosporaceae bacterium]|jgi:hypothetical protein